MINPGIVFVAAVQANNYGDHFAVPSWRFALGVVAGEATHHGCVVCLYGMGVVVVVEGEEEVVFFEEFGDVFVSGWVHGPFLLVLFAGHVRLCDDVDEVQRELMSRFILC